jgi:hypothetical protein
MVQKGTLLNHTLTKWYMLKNGKLLQNGTLQTYSIITVWYQNGLVGVKPILT